MSAAQSPSLERLLATTPHLWQGRQRSHADPNAVISTGFAALDAALPGGGWPASGLMEWVVPRWGVGELRLLLPLLLELNRCARCCAWLAPPFLPYGPALAQQGFDLRYLLLIEQPGNDRDLFWSAEKLLAHPGCGIVLAWPRQLSIHYLRRLQLAASAGQSLVIVFQQQLIANTPTPLRLKLTADHRGDALNVDIIKARGSLCRRNVRLAL